MFLFIFICPTRGCPSISFKYISCSYLSRFPRELLNEARNSNTSHVLIYRITALSLICAKIFKYISCSYLSSWNAGAERTYIIQIHLMFLFIKQQVQNLQVLHTIQIHLMFLFISMLQSYCFALSHSNTSHVLIYPF